MGRQCVIPFPSEVIKSTLVTVQIDNLITCSNLTETSKQIVTLPTVKK